MIGQKGLPATYGGIEHHVEELGARLAARGHSVDVFCRSSYTDSAAEYFRGMRVRQAWTVNTKHLDAILHSFVSSIHSMGNRFDIVHYHALGPALTAPLARTFSRAKVVLTVHGLDQERAKWGPGARQMLGLAHWMSSWVPHATVVVSRELAEHYASVYERPSAYIPNGVAAAEPLAPNEITKRWGLKPRQYVLFVGRLVPEKAPDLLIRAYQQVPGDIPLVVAGASSFTAEYVEYLHELAARDHRVILCGYVFGNALAELYSNATVFVQPSFLEGMPLTLLEAATYGTPVVASDIPCHREIIGSDSAVRLFPAGDVGSLASHLQDMLMIPNLGIGRRLQARVLSCFDWDVAAADLENLYWDLVTND